MAKKARSMHEKIADALTAAKKAAVGGGIFRSNQITKSQLKALEQGGWITAIHTTWMALINPSLTQRGESISFFTNYWEFLGKYLNERFGHDWVLSPIPSLQLQTFEQSIPQQILVHTTQKIYSVVHLKFGTSILISGIKEIDPSMVVLRDGLRIYTLEAALVESAPIFYRSFSPLLTTAFASIADIPTLSRFLVERRAQTNAGRIESCLKKIGRIKDAALIKSTMESAGFETKLTEDVVSDLDMLKPRSRSVIGVRIETMWSSYSNQLVKELDILKYSKMSNQARFFERPVEDILKEIDAAYDSDAYNSLSIEGYDITADLITKIARGETDLCDTSLCQRDRDMLAVRGYFEAFNLVKKTLRELHAGADFGETIMSHLMEWKMALFSSSVKAGILPASSLAGYRNSPVYIRDSLYVPPQSDKLVDAMTMLGELLARPQPAFQRAVLAHHMLVHIHPFVDGNGRTARFLMNVCLVVGGFPWVVIKTAARLEYFRTLDMAHREGTILPFARFLLGQMDQTDRDEDS